MTAEEERKLWANPGNNEGEVFRLFEKNEDWSCAKRLNSYFAEILHRRVYANRPWERVNPASIGVLPSVFGNVFSNSLARSGSLSNDFISVITCWKTICLDWDLLDIEKALPQSQCYWKCDMQELASYMVIPTVPLNGEHEVSDL